MSSDDLEEDDAEEEKMMESSPEFYLLRPLCIAIVKEPSLGNLDTFRDALRLLNDPPPHLGQFVVFPFAIQLKRLNTFKDKLKTRLLSTVADVFQKFEVISFQMFIEMYQRLHVALCRAEDPTKVNFTLPEDQLEAGVSCIEALLKKSLHLHFETLFAANKIHILAHSLVVLLQVCDNDVSKSMKLMALDIIQIYVSSCRHREQESRRLFRFLPGIISSVRKIVDVRVGRMQNEIFIKGMDLLQDAIIVTAEFEDADALQQPDTYLSAVLTKISNSVLQDESPGFRRSLFGATDKLLAAIGDKMPTSREVLVNNLMILNTLTETEQQAEEISGVLRKNEKYINIGFEELVEIAKTALMQQLSKNDDDCVTTLAKLSSYLTLVQLNYFELKEVLDILFSVIRDVIVVTLTRSVQDCSLQNNHPTLIMCAKVCGSLVGSSKRSMIQDIIELIEDKLTSFDGDLQSNFLGCVKFMNEVLRCQLSAKTCQLSIFQVVQFSEHYIEILDTQSTEVVLNILESEAPKTQSLLDVQKALLLEGLGCMGKIYPKDLIPVVLYHIIECAGLVEEDSFLVRDTAQETLLSLSEPKSVPEFLSEHLSCVMSDLNVRILNLSLHPNSPNAMAYLAKYYDFSQPLMVNLVDQVLSRSCDPFSGGHLQYLYSKVFYAFLVSLWTHSQKILQTNFLDSSGPTSSFLTHKKKPKQSLLEFINEYQQSLGLSPATQDNSPSDIDSDPMAVQAEMNDENLETSNENDTENIENSNPKLRHDLDLANKICRRVLNFLPNSDRAVRLLAMDCLIKGILVLKQEEDVLLPLAHITWQNLVPRMMEKDFVVVRKSFELLVCLCSTCGTFLKKRTMDEIFPKLSTLLSNLAMESEQVANKNRKVYTYSQSYKLQLTVLEGLSEICQSIDIQEEELHKVIDGCLLYLKPHQHKNLQDAARLLTDSLGSEHSTTKYRSIWTRLVALGLRELPKTPPHPSFTPIPKGLIPST